MKRAIAVVLLACASLVCLCVCALASFIIFDVVRYSGYYPSAQQARSSQVKGTKLPPSIQAAEQLIREQNCRACHGQNLTGQQLGSLYAPNLTSAGDLSAWTEADFITAMRTGKRPDGSEFNPTMPWRNIGKASDEQLGQLWAYLKALPEGR